MVERELDENELAALTIDTRTNCEPYLVRNRQIRDGELPDPIDVLGGLVKEIYEISTFCACTTGEGEGRCWRCRAGDAIEEWEYNEEPENGAG